MTSYTTQPRSFLNNRQAFAPGPVGSVGDVLVQSRLKRSYPDAPVSFDPSTGHAASVRLGNNVQDGQNVSFDTGYAGARVVDSNWGGRRGLQTCTGWVHQDLREPDRSITPYVGSTGAYGWLNKIATVYNARRTGDKFLPLPGGYRLSEGEITRGGAYPQITDVAGGSTAPLVFNINRNVDASGVPLVNDVQSINPIFNPDGTPARGYATAKPATPMRSGPAFNGAYAPLAGIRPRVR